MLRRLALVVLLLVAGAGFAQTTRTVNTNATTDAWLRSGAFRPTAAELAMAAGSGGGGAVVRRVALRAGRVIPYVGTALMLWELVDLAVQWNSGRAVPLRSMNLDVDCQLGLYEGPECIWEPGTPGVWPTVFTDPKYWQGASGQPAPQFVVGFMGPTEDGPMYSITSHGCPGGLPGLGTMQRLYSGAVLSAWSQHLALSADCLGPISKPWPEHVATDPSVAEWAAKVTGDHMTEEMAKPSYPHTYGQPLPGISLAPAPNQNQWFDNPYANPSIDTDGDGWPDWKEIEAGTDPSDPRRFPTVDPAPETQPAPDPEDDPIPLPDADGDGIPDIYDPCPFDALNSCADPVVPDPVEWPEFATEETQQRIADLLQEIRDQAREGEEEPGEDPEEPEPDPEDEGEFIAPELALDPWVPAELTVSAWEAVEARLEARWEAFAAAAGSKMMFSLGAWIPIVTLGSSSAPCEPINLTLLGQTHDIGFCSSPIHGFLSTGGRLALLALVLIGFYLATARTLSWA